MIHRYSITVAGKQRSVELEELGGSALRVTIDGRERRFDARQVEPGLWSLLDVVGTRSTTASVQGEVPALVVELDGILVPVQVDDARSALAAAAQRSVTRPAGPASVRSPMPGRVVKHLVKAGDRVTAGQGVVVVEAMKMENELKAPRPGVVRQLRCAEGEAVESGQELVTLE